MLYINRSNWIQQDSRVWKYFLISFVFSVKNCWLDKNFTSQFITRTVENNKIWKYNHVSSHVRFANPWTLIRLIFLILSSKENQTKPRSFERIFMVSIEKRVPLKFSGIIFYYNKGFRTQFEHESRSKN